jgi:hypothetical protein
VSGCGDRSPRRSHRRCRVELFLDARGGLQHAPRAGPPRTPSQSSATPTRTISASSGARSRSWTRRPTRMRSVPLSEKAASRFVPGPSRTSS